MAGEPELTGLAKHFNSVTFTGRANVAKVIFLLDTAILLIIIIPISGNLRSHSADSSGCEGQELHEEINIFWLFLVYL